LLVLFALAENFSGSFLSCLHEQSIHDGTALAYLRCSAKFVSKYNGALSAIAGIAVACLTVTLWLVNASQLRHDQQVDRAYVSGGGPDNWPGGPFVLTINNYGGTPATLVELALECCELNAIPPRPKYLDDDYKWIRHPRGVYPPGAKGWEVGRLSYAGFREPVVYGRFRYEDIWKKPHHYSFILTLAPGTFLPSNISPAYTDWT
jgi:hypothetical protein